MTLRMQTLELKIPPPVVALLVAVAMWELSRLAPLLDISAIVRATAAAIFALAGAGLDIAGFVSFRRARTTINPLRPETTSSLVCSGIYRVTRNPMYLGLLLILTAWAIFLSCAWALSGPAAFVLYINRFQIRPEERLLAGKFGTDYAAYAARVRRWL